VFKGMGLPGHMGSETVTARHLEVVRIDPEQNLLLVKGAVPGGKDGFLVICASQRGRRGSQGTSHTEE
jgi:large subunit ribosomal protein L3